MNVMRCAVTATAVSDWSIRAGYGLAKAIDSAVVRDVAGLPYIPAKTLVGLLRENSERLAESFDTADPSGDAVWHEWVDFLFGSQPDRGGVNPAAIVAPVPAALHAESLRLIDTVDGSGLAENIGVSPRELQEALTIIRRSQKVDPVTGSTVDGSLRTEERARAGQVLHGNLSVTVPDDAQESDLWPMWLLLHAATKLTDSIGGKRRRGAGEFVVKVDIPSTSTWKVEDYLDDNGFREPVPHPPHGEQHGGENAVADVLDRRHRYRVLVNTRSPIIVGPVKKGTVVTSSTFIPGGVLLGIVQRKLGLRGEDIRNNRVVVTNAYPSPDGQESTPWPRALTRKKGTTGAMLTNKFRSHTFDPKLKPSTGSYVVVAGAGKVQEISVDLVSRTHVSIEAEREPELFEYRAVPAGVQFRADVLLETGAHASPHPVAPFEARIGTSKKDDYGLVTVDITEEIVADPRAESETIAFTLALESDVLLVGDDGSYDPTTERLLRELERVLGLGAETLSIPQPVNTGTSNALSQITAVNRQESWQARWGLPRPTLIGLAAGSVVKIESCEPISAKTLAKLRTGIGIRTAEGFGQVQVNPPYLAEKTVRVVTPTSSSRDEKNAAQVDDATRLTIITGVLRDRASSTARASGTDAQSILPCGMTNTQKNKLRNLTMNMATPYGQKAVSSWFKKQNNTSFNDLQHLLTLPSRFSDCHDLLKELGRGERGEHDNLLNKVFALAQREKVDIGELITSIVQPLVVNIVKQSAPASGDAEGESDHV